MSKEKPQQYDMFTGELVDIRTSAQKLADIHAQNLRQRRMFNTQETIDQLQSKVIPHSGLAEDGSPLEISLIVQDLRTEEEKEADRMKAAEAATHPLFEPKEPSAETDGRQLLHFPSGMRFELRLLDDKMQSEPLAVIHLDDGVDLPYWSSRDEGYEWAESHVRKRGYIPKVAGEAQLELRKMDDGGAFVISYSSLSDYPVNMVIDISWQGEMSR